MIIEKVKKLFASIGWTPAPGLQKTNLYRGKKFSLEYPAHWKTTNENGILNFFPEDSPGAITVSHRPGINFPLEMTRELILDMNDITDEDPGNVRMTRKGNVTEFFYEHIDKKTKWVTKVIRKREDYYLLTINCDVEVWDSIKEPFMETINCFKVR